MNRLTLLILLVLTITLSLFIGCDEDPGPDAKPHSRRQQINDYYDKHPGEQPDVTSQY